MDFGIALMCMEHITHLSLLIYKWSAMTYAHQSFIFMQNRVILILLPWSERRVGSCISYCIILTGIAIARIHQIIGSVQLDYRRSFHHFRKNQFPRFFSGKALGQRFFLDRLQIIVQFCHPDDISVIKAHEIQVSLPVIVKKYRSIDTAFFTADIISGGTGRSATDPASR